MQLHVVVLCLLIAELFIGANALPLSPNTTETAIITAETKPTADDARRIEYILARMVCPTEMCTAKLAEEYPEYASLHPLISPDAWKSKVANETNVGEKLDILCRAAETFFWKLLPCESYTNNNHQEHCFQTRNGVVMHVVHVIISSENNHDQVLSDVFGMVGIVPDIVHHFCIVTADAMIANSAKLVEFIKYVIPLIGHGNVANAIEYVGAVATSAINFGIELLNYEFG